VSREQREALDALLREGRGGQISDLLVLIRSGVAD
jgi:hypothetical protein